MKGTDSKDVDQRHLKKRSKQKLSDSSLLERLANAHGLPRSETKHKGKRAKKRDLEASNAGTGRRAGSEAVATVERAAARAVLAQLAKIDEAGAPAALRRGEGPDKSAEAAARPTPSPASEVPPEDEQRHPDFDAFAMNMARLVEETGKAIAAYMKPIEEGRSNPELAGQVEDAVKTFGRVAEYWLSDPTRSLEAQTALSANFLALWANTLRRFGGERMPPIAALDPNDRRFADPEWDRNPMFDFVRQAYTLSSRWITDMVSRADLDEKTREKALFYARQLVSALSPTNFVATNPELIRETIERNGENLVRGMRMLAEDIEAGRGRLRIRQTDASKFTLGVDMAATPGKVIYRNDLIELLQYSPTTDRVFRRPLLIVPPWINKYYILDLNPEKSFVRWAVSQGLTVFMISWVNPDERHADKSFNDYMREGIFAALEAVEAATGEREVAALGYCVGGTLLAATLAFMAAEQDDRIPCASFLATQVDFRDAGDLKIFVDEARVRALESSMKTRGYLEGAQMATAFNMLRPTELIWNYVVNNYLKGKEPVPFDLLAWNSDSTRMPAANHSFYLRNCYIDNKLARGEMEIEGRRLDLRKVTIPLYSLATKEDHIAPARSVYAGAQIFGGPMRYVMAGSGHIAGVVNPVAKPKYQFWTGPQPRDTVYEDWLLSAQEHAGSWWPDWLDWLVSQAPEKVSARIPGEGALAAIGEAPGDYVRVKS